MSFETFFNELSYSKTLSREILSNIIECRNAMQEKNITVCRMSHNMKSSLLLSLQKIPGIPKQTINNFFYAFFHSPFEKDDMSQEIEDEFLYCKYLYNGKVAEGLGWAEIYKTLSFSLLSSDEWDAPTLKIQKGDVEVDVHNVSRAEHVEQNADWLLQFEKLTECQISPKDKQCHLKDDHGKDKLQAFWEKISENPYVEGCINSLPFNPDCKKFIKQVYPDGKIEIVLVKADAGYGMIIQTTGKGQYQTQKIADMLLKKYGRQ